MISCCKQKIPPTFLSAHKCFPVHHKLKCEIIHLCQLSRTIWKSPMYRPNLLLSRMNHRISQIKHKCAWNATCFCHILADIWNFWEKVFDIWQEPTTWSLHITNEPLESTLSDLKLFIKILFAENSSCSNG